MSYEEHRSDWSHQVSAVATTRGLQHDQTLPLCETNEHKQEFYIVSQAGLTSFLKKEKGWINCAYNMCSTTSHSAVMVLVSLVPRLYFSRLVENWVWSTAYSIFVQIGQNAGALFFSNECLTALKIAVHIV